MSVLGIGLVFLAISVFAYAVTRSGIRVTFHVPLSVPDEVLLGLAAVVLSALTVLCGVVAAVLATTGASAAVQWSVALGATLLVAVPAARRTWAAAPRQTQLVQDRRDVRAGRAPRPEPEKGRHQR
jgi:hypothetical protein